MTIRDPEVLEALRDEPELLAIADAVAETQRSTRSSPRRAVSRSAALVAVGAAVLAAVLLWPSGGGRHRILDRAQAAIGDGPVLHLIARVPADEELVNIRTGRSTVPTYEVESWSDRDVKRVHMIFRIDGRVVGEMLLPQDGSGAAVDVGPAYVALWTGYREALAAGTAKIAREGTLYGHSVYWLVFPAPGGGSARNEVAIDRKTYQPLDFRFRMGSRQLDERVLLARTEPVSASAFTRLTSRPSLLSGGTSHSSGVLETPVRPGKVAKGWLEAGLTLGGLKLSSVSPTQDTSGGKTSTGLELVYGSDASFRRSVTIDETRSPVDHREWESIPKGSIRITKGGGSDENGGEYVLWSGYVVEDGVYVTIQTGVSRASVLEAARALRPA